MADEKKTAPVFTDDLTAKIAASVAQAVASATVQVQERIAPVESRKAGLRSPFNPEGLEVRPKLGRRYIFCGGDMEEKFLTNREIELVNKITKAGTYHNGKWHVRVRKDDGGNDTVFIDLPVKSLDDRMSIPHSLTVILEEIIAGQAAL